jgi:hypothetical protein
MPSPLADRPGLMIRDPYRYSEAVIIVPPPLVECLQCFDGRQTDLDLRAILVQITGDLEVGDLEENLVEALRSAASWKTKRSPNSRKAARVCRSAAPAYRTQARPIRINRTAARSRTQYMAGTDGAAARPVFASIAAPRVRPAAGSRISRPMASWDRHTAIARLSCWARTTASRAVRAPA